jgi:hypothetical protein
LPADLLTRDDALHRFADTHTGALSVPLHL